MDIEIPWLFYRVPDTAPGEILTPFTDRFYDEREHWGTLGVGVVYGTTRPYFGPLPPYELGDPVGTPDQWLNGLSYEVWMAGGYKNPYGCWNLGNVLPIRLHQQQQLTTSWYPPLRLRQLQGLVFKGALGLWLRQEQRLKLAGPELVLRQLQALTLRTRFPLALNQVQALTLRAAGQLRLNQVQALTLRAAGQLRLNQVQAFILETVGRLRLNQVQALTLSEYLEPTPLNLAQLQALTLRTRFPLALNQVQALTLREGFRYTGTIGSSGSFVLVLTVAPSSAIIGRTVTGPCIQSGTTALAIMGNRVTLSLPSLCSVGSSVFDFI